MPGIVPPSVPSLGASKPGKPPPVPPTDSIVTAPPPVLPLQRAGLGGGLLGVAGEPLEPLKVAILPRDTFIKPIFGETVRGMVV